MKKLNLMRTQLENLQKQEQKLCELIQKEENLISKKQLEKYRKEIDNDYLLKLKQEVKNTYIKLCSPDFPKDGICSHFGVSKKIKSDTLSFSIQSYSFKDKKLLITLYRTEKTNLENSKPVGYSIKQHEKKLNTILKALNTKTFDIWNNNENSNGFSVVVTIDVPDSLATAIYNYRNLNNVFQLTKTEEDRFKKFKNWINSK